MPATQNVLEELVLAELVRLQKDQSALERLYQRLPDGATRKASVEARFLSLWADVEQRADRLDQMLDNMAFLPGKRALAVVPYSPPSAA